MTCAVAELLRPSARHGVERRPGMRWNQRPTRVESAEVSLLELLHRRDAALLRAIENGELTDEINR